MLRIFAILLCLLATTALGPFVTTASAQSGFEALLADNQKAIEKPSRKTIDAVLASLLEGGHPQTPQFLEKWRGKEVWMRKEDKRFFFARKEGKDYMLLDISTGQEAGVEAKKALKQLKPNSGVRGVIANALVRFQLSDPDITRRSDGLQAIERDPQPNHLEPLRASIEAEPDAQMMARKVRLERLLTMRFDESDAARIAAIESFAGDPSLDARAALNPILVTRRHVAKAVPEGTNIAAMLTPGTDLPQAEAYEMLVAAKLAEPRVSDADIATRLAEHIEDGRVGGTNVGTLSTDNARRDAYQALAKAGLVPKLILDDAVTAAVEAHVFYDAYIEGSPEVTTAASVTLSSINTAVASYQAADLVLDGLSLASIYFLAAIGLAITFGVMGVINMAHGEFITLGAYTGFVVQLFIPDYTLSLIVALPLAFAVTFAAGVAMERLVIRFLYHRPLETLLATFGISIAIQQILKNIFGTQARPLTSPDWLGGAWVWNDVVSISYIRIAIFGLGVVFFVALLLILNRTRLGLEVRAVTQNPAMAASMGINPDKINMLTFGLGSGIAGIAGVAIGLYAKVTSEMGADYIVQSFMTVVVGGVGNIWGTLLGATMIGFLQKGIEFFNPSNTLAAQTYMILFIILFIQFRPKGIIALKGRAAGA